VARWENCEIRLVLLIEKRVLCGEAVGSGERPCAKAEPDKRNYEKQGVVKAHNARSISKEQSFARRNALGRPDLNETPGPERWS